VVRVGESACRKETVACISGRKRVSEKGGWVEKKVYSKTSRGGTEPEKRKKERNSTKNKER